MPELPEVECIAAALRETVLGLTVDGIEVYKPQTVRYPRRWREAAKQLEGKKIVQVGRRAKRFYLVTEGGRALLIQLGMTGTMRLRGAEAERVKHTHMEMRLGDGQRLQFVDPRRFGRLAFLRIRDGDRPDEDMEKAGFSRLGPEPLGMKRRELEEILKTSRPVKALLLDQARIAGLGNIYVDEALYGAGIDPARPAERIGTEEAGRLLKEIKSVLRRSIRQGGTTLNDFRHPGGQWGGFSKRLKVYRRTGQRCGRCGGTIERTVIIGRSSHYCPGCQR